MNPLLRLSSASCIKAHAYGRMSFSEFKCAILMMSTVLTVTNCLSGVLLMGAFTGFASALDVVVRERFLNLRGRILAQLSSSEMFSSSIVVSDNLRLNVIFVVVDVSSSNGNGAAFIRFFFSFHYQAKHRIPFLSIIRQNIKYLFFSHITNDDLDAA